MNGKLRTLSILAALALALPTAATAQSIPPPPVRQPVDDNGVDLARGTFNWSLTDLSIGSGERSLSYTRFRYGSSIRDNLVLGLQILDNGDLPDTATVSIGGSAEGFFKNGEVWSSQSGNGVSLVQNGDWFYTSADGTVIRFEALTGAAYGDYQTTGLARYIEFPNGMRWTYSYDQQALSCPDNLPFGATCPPNLGNVYRLSRVTDSFGRQLKLKYQSDSNADGTMWFTLTGVAALNTNVEDCNPFVAQSCVNSWPQISLNADRTDATLPDGSHNVVNSSGASGPGIAPVAVTYAASGRVATVTRAGVTWSYAYVDAGGIRTTTVSGPSGVVRTVTSYAGLGVILSDKDADNRTTSYTYDGWWRVGTVVAPEGNEVRYEYDARGNVSSTAQWGKPATNRRSFISGTATYPLACANPKTCNQPATTADSRGDVTEYAYYGAHGGVDTITQPAQSNGVRPQTRFGYTLIAGVYLPSEVSTCQSLAAPACVGTADDARTVVTYNASGPSIGLPASAGTSAGNGSLLATATFTYDMLGNLVSVDGPLSSAADTTRFHYDSLRRATGTVGPDPDGTGPLKPRATRTSYNSDGLPTLVEQGTMTDQMDWSTFEPLQYNSTAYDSYRRPILSIAGSAGSAPLVATQQSYDSLGRPECSAQRMNAALFGSLPTSACTLGDPGADGPDRIAKTSYSPASQVAKITRAFGTSLAVDEISYQYTPNGQVASFTDANGNLTQNGYDDFDRLVSRAYPSPTTPGVASSTDREQWDYDQYGLMSSWTARGGGTVAFAWDALGRLASKDRPSGETDTYFTYDNLGRVTWVRDGSPSGPGVGMTYDALGRVVSQSTYGRTLGYEYDAAGRRTRLIWPDNFSVTYDYDTVGGITAVREYGVTSGAGVLARFASDPATAAGQLGLRTGVTRGNGVAETLAFDGLGRLTSLGADLAGSAADQAATFSYNAASQIVQRARSNDIYAFMGNYNVNRHYTANGLNQYTTAGPASFAYDARGNLASDGSLNLTYDIENRLTAASGSKTATLAWDPLDRLASIASPATGTTAFLYDGDDLVAEYDPLGNLLRRYVHGPGIDQPLVWYEGSGIADRRQLVVDERGSVISVTDATGAAIATNSYDSWGIPSAQNVGRFGYTGQAYLPELGMYHYKARIYSPTMGRFLQTDPIGIDGGVNLYAYAENDPINSSDPSGTVAVVDDAALITVTAKLATPLIVKAAAVVTGIPTVALKVVKLFTSIFGGGHKAPKPPEAQPSQQAPEASQNSSVKNAAVTTICQRRDWHNLKVKERVGVLRSAGFDVAENVRIVRQGLPDWQYAVTDYIARAPGATGLNSFYYLGEVKTGEASLTPNQTINYKSGLTRILSDNAKHIGLLKGEAIPIIYTGIDRFPGCPSSFGK